MSKASPCQRRDGMSKNDYPTRHAARVAVRNLQGGTGKRFGFYRCPSCRQHHLTSQVR